MLNISGKEQFSMRKVFNILSVIAALAVGTLGLSAPLLPVAKAAPAVHELDVECGFIIDGDGNPFFVPEPAREIRTQSEEGNVNYICKVDDVPNSTGKAVKFTSEDNPFVEGLVCLDSQGGETTQWVEVVSASGKATLQCHFKD
jgi:hypothetical protein